MYAQDVLIQSALTRNHEYASGSAVAPMERMHTLSMYDLQEQSLDAAGGAGIENVQRMTTLVRMAATANVPTRQPRRKGIPRLSLTAHF